MMVMRSPHMYTGTIDQRTRFNGHRMAHDCHRWMERNQCAFMDMYRYVKGMQRNRRRGRVRDNVACFCLQKNITVGAEDASPYKFANGYWAGIARYMVLSDPSLLNDPIDLHNSDIDTYGLLPVSWMKG